MVSPPLLPAVREKAASLLALQGLRGKAAAGEITLTEQVCSSDLSCFRPYIVPL
jgi:hypothetical protein